MNAAHVEPGATARNKDVGGDGVVEERFAAPEIVSQHSTCARMNGYKARPAVFGTANRQNSIVDIHVAELEV